MRRPVRWPAILVLALTLVPCQYSTADAGVIPWLYDAVFGPVGHYGYGGYGYGYGYRYPYGGTQLSYRYVTPSPVVYSGSSSCGPAGCGPSGCSIAPIYQVGYRPFFSSPAFCTTGTCGVRCAVSNCGTCSTGASNSTCQAKTAWKSQEAKTEWNAEVIRGESAVPTPATADEAPKPTTFEKGSTASTGQSTAVGKVVAEDSTDSSQSVTSEGTTTGEPDWTRTGKPTVAASEDTASTESSSEKTAGSVDSSVDVKAGASGTATTETDSNAAGFGDAVRGGGSPETFREPVPGVKSAVDGNSVPAKTPALPEGLPESEVPLEAAPELDINLPLELENKSSWKVEVPVRRFAFRPGFGRATVARTAIDVDVDYVVPASTSLRLVSR